MQENSNIFAPPPERGDKTTRLEAFVDAAFAFALTLLVIAGGQLPRNVDDLIAALKNVPTFAASFALIVVFWKAHVDWSRQYGLDDAHSRRWSLLLVFIVLIFVYPLRMVFSSLFALLTHGALPASFSIGAWTDIPAMFITYGVAYGALCATMWQLFRHAWRCRDALGLSADERIQTRLSLLRWQWLVVVAVASVLTSALMLAFGDPRWNALLGLPGYLYAANGLLRPLTRWQRRRLEAAATRP